MFDQLRRYARSVANESCIRPWGFSIVLGGADECHKRNVREKLLILKPGQGIALERHLGYSELWLPESRLEYALENDEGVIHSHAAAPYRAVMIPRGSKHRMRNSGVAMVYVYEVQMGVITDSDKEVFPDDDINLAVRS